MEDKTATKYHMFQLDCPAWSLLTQESGHPQQKKHPDSEKIFYVLKGHRNKTSAFPAGTVSTDMWSMLLSISGLSWVMPQSTKEAFECWSSWKAGIRQKHMKDSTLHWLEFKAERNRRWFDGLSTPNQFTKARNLLNLAAGAIYPLTISAFC